MAGIGGVACDFVRGDLRALKERVEVWSVPGIDGYGAQKLGLGDADFLFTGVIHDTVANVTAWVAAIAALQGTALVSIVDDWGVTFTNCLITRVGMPRRSAWKDGSIACRCELDVEGVKTA